MKPVADAFQSGDLERAGSLLREHLRLRHDPPGPTWEEVKDVVLHPDYVAIAQATLDGKYGTVGWFSQFASGWTDAAGNTHPWVNADGTINRARDNGHLNRHFHWVSLAKAWQDTGDARYAHQFSHGVQDWVTREPFFWDRCPQVGGINTMDGTVCPARRRKSNQRRVPARSPVAVWTNTEVAS